MELVSWRIKNNKSEDYIHKCNERPFIIIITNNNNIIIITNCFFSLQLKSKNENATSIYFSLRKKTIIKNVTTKSQDLIKIEKKTRLPVACQKTSSHKNLNLKTIASSKLIEWTKNKQSPPFPEKKKI